MTYDPRTGHMIQELSAKSCVALLEKIGVNASGTVEWLRFRVEQAYVECDVLLAIILDAGRAQARQPVPVDGPLPAQELVHRERVTLAGILHGQQPAAHGRHDYSFSADHPPFRVPRWKIGHS
jgi:hypothetical protein